MYIAVCACIITPLFSVEEGKDMLAGHEAFLDIAQLQVVHLQHVLLLLLLQEAKEKHTGCACEGEKGRDWLAPWVRNLAKSAKNAFYSFCNDIVYKTRTKITKLLQKSMLHFNHCGLINLLLNIYTSYFKILQDELKNQSQRNNNRN